MQACTTVLSKLFFILIQKTIVSRILLVYFSIICSKEEILKVKTETGKKQLNEKTRLKLLQIDRYTYKIVLQTLCTN